MNINEIVRAQNPWWANGRTPPIPEYRRELHSDVFAQLTDISDRRAVVLRGPRQVGKTTILKQVIEDLIREGWPLQNILYFDFSDERITADVTVHEVLATQPEMQNAEIPRIILFDEIGRTNNWDRWLKRVVDQEQDRIAVTDSSSTILRSGSMESGLGRWDEVILEGMTFSEFLGITGGGKIPVEQVAERQPRLLELYLRNGGFPEHASNEDVQQVSERLRNDIVGKAILHDLIRYGIDVQGAKRLFAYLIQNSGLILNVSGIAKEIGDRDRRAVNEWIDLLEDTQLISRIERYAVSPAVRQKAHPKVYASDHGLISAFSVLPYDEQSVQARIIEAVVFRHLRECARISHAELYFYRDHRHRECDFVWVTSEETLAIEVTASRRIRSEKIDNLVHLIGDENWDGGLLLYTGFDERVEKGIDTVPVSRFLLSPLSTLGQTP